MFGSMQYLEKWARFLWGLFIIWAFAQVVACLFATIFGLADYQWACSGNRPRLTTFVVPGWHLGCWIDEPIKK